MVSTSRRWKALRSRYDESRTWQLPFQRTEDRKSEIRIEIREQRRRSRMAFFAFLSSDFCPLSSERQWFKIKPAAY